MKNKIIGLMLATAMMVTVAGCGKQITPAENITDEKAAEASVEETESAQTTEEAPAETEAVEEAADNTEEVEFTTGTINGNVYENEYFGLKLTVPSDYFFLDDETLAQISGMAADIMKDEKAAAAALENGTAAIVAYANKENAGDNINVTIQSNATLANAIFDEKAIMEASMAQLKSVLEGQGAEISSCELVESEVAGENHYVIVLSGTINGVHVDERVVNIQKGDYMMAFAASCFGEDNTEALFAGIEKIH